MSTAQRLTRTEHENAAELSTLRCLYCRDEFTTDDVPVKLAGVLVAHEDCAGNPARRRTSR